MRGRLRVLVNREESQAAFCRVTGVTTASLSEWLTTGLPSLRMLGVVQEATGVSLDWLVLGVGGDGPRFLGESRAEPSIATDMAAAVSRRVKERAKPSRVPGIRENRAYIRERWALDPNSFFEACVVLAERHAGLEAAAAMMSPELAPPKRGDRRDFRNAPTNKRRRKGSQR